MITCLSKVNYPLASLIKCSTLARVIPNDSLPASVVADETSQVYLGAPIMKILTSYPFYFALAIPPFKAFLIALIPSKERHETLKFAIVLMMGLLNLR